MLEIGIFSISVRKSKIFYILLKIYRNLQNIIEKTDFCTENWAERRTL